MAGKIQGRYVVQVWKTFADTVHRSQLVELCQELGLPSEPRKDDRYPVVLFNRLMDEGSKRFWPELTLEEAQYRHGKDTLLIFKNTVAGKVSLALSGSDLKQLASTVPQFYQAIATSGKVNYVDTGEKSYRLEFRGFESSPHYHHGGLAETVYSMEPNAKCKMNILKMENPEPGVYLSDMDFICVLP